MDYIKLHLFAAFLVLVAAVLAKEADLNSKNYYDILGVDEKASLADIKKNYKALVRKYHPDKLPRDQKGNKALVKKREKQFNAIKTAYEELSDNAKRQRYDWQLQGEKSGFGRFHPEGHQRFESMFGNDFFMHFDPFQNDDVGDSFFGSFGSQFTEPQINPWVVRDDFHHHYGHKQHDHEEGYGHGQKCQVFVHRTGNTVRKTVQCF